MAQYIFVENPLLCYIQSTIGTRSDDEIVKLVEIFFNVFEVKKAIKILSDSTDHFEINHDVFPILDSCRKYTQQIMHHLERLHVAEDVQLPTFVISNISDVPPRPFDQVKPTILGENLLEGLHVKFADVQDTINELRLKLDEMYLVQQQKPNTRTSLRTEIESARLEEIEERLILLENQSTSKQIPGELNEGIKYINTVDTSNENQDVAIISDPVETLPVSSSSSPTRKSDLHDARKDDLQEGENSSAGTLDNRNRGCRCSRKKKNRQRKRKTKKDAQSNEEEQVETINVDQQTEESSPQLNKTALVIGSSNVNRFRKFVVEALGNDPRYDIYSFSGATMRTVVTNTIRYFNHHNETSNQLVVIHAGLNDIVNYKQRKNRSLDDVWNEVEDALNQLVSVSQHKKIRLVVCSIPLADGFKGDCLLINSRLQTKFANSSIIFKDLSYIQENRKNMHFDGVHFGIHGARRIAQLITCELADHLGVVIEPKPAFPTKYVYPNNFSNPPFRRSPREFQFPASQVMVSHPIVPPILSIPPPPLPPIHLL